MKNFSRRRFIGGLVSAAVLASADVTAGAVQRNRRRDPQGVSVQADASFVPYKRQSRLFPLGGEFQAWWIRDGGVPVRPVSGRGPDRRIPAAFRAIEGVEGITGTGTHP